MPIANAFLTPEEFKDEYFFELQVGFCPTCAMVQLVAQPDREMMFHEHYAFFSSTSARMAEHFKKFAELVTKEYVKSPNPFVVEIGSNDGIMLQNFAKSGIRHLGIEPSANVAQVAIDRGIQTITCFFDEQLAREIVAEHGQADAFLGANVMCHIPYLHSVAAGIAILLKPQGVLVFEDPYLGDIIEKTSYDQIYDEHVFYFSVASVSHLFEQHGLEVIDVQPQSVHGGSMRYVLGHKGMHPVSAAVIEQREREQKLGLNKLETYERFRRSVECSRDELIRLLFEMKHQDKRVVGYAATSKSTTVTNYCVLRLILWNILAIPHQSSKVNTVQGHIYRYFHMRSSRQTTLTMPCCLVGIMLRKLWRRSRCFGRLGGSGSCMSRKCRWLNDSLQ
jgi:methylation protein EvaC